MKIKQKYWDLIVSGEKTQEFRRDRIDGKIQIMTTPEGKLLGALELKIELTLVFDLSDWQTIYDRWNLKRYWIGDDFINYFQVSGRMYIYNIKKVYELKEINIKDTSETKN